MRLLLLIGVPLLAVAGLVTSVVTRAPEVVPVVEASRPPSPTAAPLVTVDVVGAVARPGVVRLPLGARVLDALLAAGGMTGDADLYALNKAAPLIDGMRIYVPRPGEVPPAGILGLEAEKKIDLNTASAKELEDLPGVGPSIAARIVRARVQRRFAKVDELQTRGLVSARVFADLRDLVTIH